MTSLGKSAEQYLALRRALGYKLKIQGWLLQDFTSYAERAGSRSITTELALAWATQAGCASPGWGAIRLGIVRRFARYLHAIDTRTEIPPQELLPYRKHRATPWLYSRQHVRILVRDAAALRGPLWGSTCATLFGLLAATGLRVGEAIALDRQDVDARERLLLVRGSKFGKSREVALHSTAVKALLAYARKRDSFLPHPRSPAFFLSQKGTRLLYNNVHRTFIRLVRASCLGDDQPNRPRIHDLRHSFAVNTLLDWYRRGRDVEAQLPLLSTYLGHVSPVTTYWYLSAAPELLALAAERLERSLSFGDVS